MRQSKRAALLLLFLLTTAVTLPMIPTAEAAGPGWAEQLQAMDEALGRGDAAAAQAAWREAYATAHASHGWPGMIAVGDAALRLGRATDTAAVSETRARRVYLTALLRARRDRSLDGVLTAGEAFGRLGDRDVVQQAAAIAADLAARSGDDLARRRVQTFRSQWVARPLT
jgi:hypothetical protein